MQENIVPHEFQITPKDRTVLKGHKAFLIWFTGLSGSGKSTIANGVEKALYQKTIHTYLLDGDNLRKGLNKDLGFSPEDRSENIRRISEIASLFVDAGVVVLAAFVSPYKNDREMIRNTVKDDNFVEIFVDTPLEECEKRDVKGLYAKARTGEIKNFTGISAPYERPEAPDLRLDTTLESIEESVEKVIGIISKRLDLE